MLGDCGGYRRLADPTGPDERIRRVARDYKQATGQSPHCYVSARRLERSKVLLIQGDRSLVDIALALGLSCQLISHEHLPRRWVRHLVNFAKILDCDDWNRLAFDFDLRSGSLFRFWSNRRIAASSNSDWLGLPKIPYGSTYGRVHRMEPLLTAP